MIFQCHASTEWPIESYKAQMEKRGVRYFISSSLLDCF